MRKKIIIGALLVLALATTGFFLLRKETSGSIKWETKPVEKGSINNIITATGTLEAVKTVQIGTQVSGIIANLYIDYNTKVKMGQLIATIDTTTLAANLFDAKANVYRQQIQVNQTKRNYERTKALYEQKVVAEIEYDKAMDDYETAKSSLLSSQAQLNRAEINLGYATIRAPIDGVVLSKSVEQGQTVAASFNSPTLFTIANDLSKMQVQASIDEADIGQVAEGQKVTFTVDAYPDDEFSGSVKQIRLQPVIVSNVVTYIVIIDVPNPDLKLMPGMTANISVVISEADNVLKVPSKALSFRPPNFYLNELIANLPDTTKARINERIEAMKSRMKEMGMSDADISTRVESMRLSMAFGGSQRRTGGGGTFFGPGGGGPGFGGGGQAVRQVRPRTSNSGQLWVLEGNSLKLIRVRTGLSDGTYTSVESPEITDSMSVVIAAVYDKKLDQVTNQNTNPLVPQMRGPRGMR
jgi:HlyD family secretion protein